MKLNHTAIYSVTSALILTIGLTGCQTFKKSDTFKPMAHTEETLPNGLKVLWIEDAKIPSFGLKLLLPVGAAHDPKGQDGVASLVAALLDKGTAKRNATQIASELERLGLSFKAGADEDSTFVGIDGLSIHAEKATEEMFDLLTNSQFSDAEIKRGVELTSAQIKKMFDNPKAVATLAFEKTLYNDHPYAHLGVGSEKTLRKLKRAQVMNFYKSHYHPQSAVLAVVGKYGEAERQKVRSLFAAWKNDGKPLAAIPAPKVMPKQIVFVEKSGLMQAEIRFGHLGIPRKHPDYLKLRVANTILGESFIGRLFSEIREKRGLTYSIYSYFDARETQGPFAISTFTRLDKIPEMIEETMAVHKSFVEGVSEADVKDAVAYLKGSFPQVIETADDLAKQMLILHRYDVDRDYLATFMSEVSKVTASQVNEVIKTHFKPEEMLIVVYGPPGSEVGLEKFGKVLKIKPTSLN